MNNNISYLLTDDDVKKIIGYKNIKNVAYYELSKYKTLDELFGNSNIVILLYVHHIGPQEVTGHWTLLTRVKRKGKTIIEFNDSYGQFIDDITEKYSKEWKKRSNQQHNYLSRLLHDFINDKDKILYYNEIQFQSSKKGINSCGRWCALRGRFYKVPLEVWQKSFLKLKDKGYDLDKVITYLTNQYL